VISYCLLEITPVTYKVASDTSSDL